MPDITSVLERAAAEPTREPDVERPLRNRRMKRVAITTTTLVAVVVLGLVLAPGSTQPQTVSVASPPSTVPTVLHVDNAWLSVPAGWHVAAEPHAWWLTMPKELFSVSSVPLPPSPHVDANEAICPSEIPRVVAENLPTAGAYLWIGKGQANRWTGPGQPYRRFAEREFHEMCDLPRGLVARGTTLNSGSRDYWVYYITGPDTSEALVRDIAVMIDGLRFDPEQSG